VVRYRAIDLPRSNGKHVARHASDDRLESHSAADDPFENAAKRDDAQRLQASITMLLDAQAEVSTLAYYGVPSGQRLHRRTLNEQLGPAG
jgi:DNA-directed RNA polymerase specialized sigma24 family protein